MPPVEIVGALGFVLVDVGRMIGSAAWVSVVRVIDGPLFQAAASAADGRKRKL